MSDEKSSFGKKAAISFGIGAVIAGGSYLINWIQTRRQNNTNEAISNSSSITDLNLSKNFNGISKGNKKSDWNSSPCDSNKTDEMKKSFDSYESSSKPEKSKTEELTNPSECKGDSHNDLNELFKEVDDLFEKDGHSQKMALNLLKELKTSSLKNPNVLWRLAKGYQLIAKSQTDIELKKNFIISGLQHASEAIKLEFFNLDAHKWYALLIFMEYQYLPISEKKEKGSEFLKHANLVLFERKNDYLLHYSLAKFKYEGLTDNRLKNEFSEFGVSDVISELKLADSLSPKPCKEIKFLLAKCYLLDNDVAEALDWLKASWKVESKNDFDAKCDEEISSLLKKLQT
ncbi:conserved hypothetical protein [Pediculus humanus corporis]|uniref:Regulator of microtubule dynamics protein n=1 Tax=Pediculus humanus subsp. corporis TaxID=121224 RepID=E0VLK2_PEDHC|nr:uncharacterized protein Phum_PHUM288750 [Pediculus humanus corporis]EEB14258.1 conserved hypothetical protein [Pediculus humanus corporis]